MKSEITPKDLAPKISGSLRGSACLGAWERMTLGPTVTLLPPGHSLSLSLCMEAQVSSFRNQELTIIREMPMGRMCEEQLWTGQNLTALIPSLGLSWKPPFSQTKKSGELNGNCLKVYS